MTTDMSNKSVEELRLALWGALYPAKTQPEIGRDLFDELARRLEEAQQKIISHQAKSRRIGKWMSAALDDPTVCEEMKADINFFMLDDFASLAAHDAKVAAEAKAEALEESADRLVPDQQVHTMFLKDCLRSWAAEYRAKATEAGRKE